jgi:hypothetical protein
VIQALESRINYCNYQTQKEKDTLKEAIEMYKEKLKNIIISESNDKNKPIKTAIIA